MRSLLQFTLDLFDPEPQAPVPRAATPPAAKPHPASDAATAPAMPGVPLGSVLAPAQFHHPRANRQTRLCEAQVAYEFKRGKRRTIGMQVGADGLVVSAPRWVPLYEVEAALQEKANWIVRKLDEMRARQQRLEAARIEWRDGVSLPFLGAPLRVVLDAAAPAAALHEPADCALRLGLSQTAAPEQIRDAAQAWLMRQARALFIERLDHYAPQLGVQWRKLSLSSAGTRWGSAGADGAIRLNWRLIHFRQDVIDYVVAHELSHLRVMDHSPRFWETVESVMPGCRELRDSLKDDAIPRW